jgi:hypothetical protein
MNKENKLVLSKVLGSIAFISVVIISLLTVAVIESQERYMYDFINTYKDSRYNRVAKELRDAPKCSGPVILNFGRTTLSVERSSKINVNHTKGTFRKGGSTTLDTPNPNYSCKQKELKSLKKVSFRKLSGYIRSLELIPEEYYVSLDYVFGRGQYRRGDHHTVSRYISGENGKEQKKENNFRRIEDLNDGIVKVSRLGEIHYILPLNIFPTENKNNVVITCRDYWDQEYGSYVPKELCDTIYMHPMGLSVKYSTSSYDIEERLIEIEAEARGWLLKLFSNY